VKTSITVMAALIASCGLAAGEPVRPTYARDVAPILARACADCHRPGRIAPFSLLTFEDVRPRAHRIAEVVSSREMPPWKPVAGYGSFQGARRLTDHEISTVVEWVAHGAPAGRPQPTATVAETHEWELGPPDQVLQMAEPFDIRPTGEDIYQCFVIRLDLEEDRYISAIEIHPGNPRVLHHSIVFLDATGEARRLDAADPQPGYASFGGPGFMPVGALGGWSPGGRPVAMPRDTGKHVGRNVDLVLHNHYRPDGVPERDRSLIGLYFVRGTPAKQLVTIPILRRDLRIPAGEPDYRLHTTFTTPTPLEIVSVLPHMHELGREMKVFATRPTGEDVPLIWIRDWDPHWQGEYAYERPVMLPAGSLVTVEASYDNSVRNRRNPNDPPIVVAWGNGAADEMALCLLQVTVTGAVDARRITAAILGQPGLRD
jgi:hypothetical protein